ncbi:MAG TPA: hypothetical protein VF487_09735 [Chitinophagaceae bacterium]
MKLAPLLANYLYSQKKLDLPGIGSFMLDPSVSLETDPKQQKSFVTEGISFENNPAIKDCNDLINYISSQTGKMKALAAADLSSHLELIQQFLNIGKPFLLEGIGSLVKIKSGKFEFTSGTVQAEKLKDLTAREATATSAKEESFSSYEPSTHKKISAIAWKKPVLFLLAIAGIGIAVWGGYTIYKRNSAKTTSETSLAEKQLETVPVTDTALAAKEKTTSSSSSLTLSGYKFVLETATKKRALNRYSTLKKYQWDVHLETKDSLQFKLFLVLNATDTTRALDSLTALNGRKVYIEKFN